ncbi:MAG: DNA-binding domain-containing protein [Oleispira sp.]
MTINNTDLEAMKTWQKNFYRGIFNPTPANIDIACMDVIETKELSAQDRLIIYRGSILGGITTALMGIYPVCLKLVGEQFFTQMVAGYLRKYPSGSPDLGDYGAHLGDYLAEFIISHDAAQHLVYLPDTARLEWLWHQAFNASEVEEALKTCRSLAELVLVEVEQQGDIVFKLAPSVGVMQSAYPVDQIWQLNQLGGEPRGAVDLDVGGNCFIVQRNNDFDMIISVLSQDEFMFLGAIDSGKSFAQIAELEFNSSVSDLLATSLQSGLIVGFRVNV